ncbi:MULTISPECIES: type II toxin-antitoxin system VapC family toxin [unclassified Xanthobacter]|uniref:type II toxin-antitoxin system VapC family toxin n=1 Tax=unclassified Xanthobacter TaxID=2623496 RepID=UPI001EDCA54D|nr:MULTISPECIES: type II toxin-antitoxin system VapC family toxin [unclassified Xanthobacter]
MILVDTSIWIDHLRVGDALLVQRLEAAEVLCHPFVLGELALGSLRQRHMILNAIASLPQAVQAEDGEVLALIEAEKLFGEGIGYVDAHLLAATRLTAGGRLWTRDRRLNAIGTRLGVAAVG